MELTGKIIVLQDTETVGTKGFQKRVFVVETTEDKYPQKIALEFTKDKCDVLDGFSVGQNVKVEFNIRGSEYNGRYYVSLQAWKIAAASGAPAARPAARPAATGARPAGRPAAATRPAPAQAAGDEDAPW